MLETLKKNIKNKTWWVAVISALVLLGQSHGLDLQKYIGTNWQDTLNTIFSLLVLFGVSVDTTAIRTNSDDTTSNSTENKVSTDSTSTNASLTDSSNSSTNTDTSASAKIKVVNPDNVTTIEANQTANATSVSQPQ